MTPSGSVSLVEVTVDGQANTDREQRALRRLKMAVAYQHTLRRSTSSRYAGTHQT